MKIINYLSIIFLFSIFNVNAFAENNKDCKSIKADTGVKVFQKIKCKMGGEKGDSLGNKFKNIFKKKN